ncbi:cyanoexosortase B system-associated protein [Leptothoe kymatousa]|uniref:Cyanoexosortase B system-associated protein n=1 Tax=Leptothoe kymatousa TAU-MAC 1615 TaxID=2364775 RepID=A0ABS5Y8M8_9CYAN|nr:cyanoexosortase B system-associated protein [Leptothoe kymatousa]MBT9313300.1 cyanoexosortase B system-associated protein [Leptothoe kymatousa TAU-MAC 1615]
MAVSFSSSDSKARFQFKWLVVAILALIITVVALPQYFSAQWPWQSPPDVEQIRDIRALKENGLALEGWSQEFQQKIQLGGDQWSVQQLNRLGEATPQQMVLFLKPQGVSTDQPEVEWIDLQGAQKWQTSNQRRLRVDNLMLNTFRAWNAAQTFAVAQWYATPQNGHPAPYHWFWRDQQYQWSRGSRLPWVAVSVLIPMPPLGEMAPVYEDLEQLSQQVQASLDATVFREES